MHDHAERARGATPAGRADLLRRRRRGGRDGPARFPADAPAGTGGLRSIISMNVRTHSSTPSEGQVPATFRLRRTAYPPPIRHASAMRSGPLVPVNVMRSIGIALAERIVFMTPSVKGRGLVQQSPTVDTRRAAGSFSPSRERIIGR